MLKMITIPSHINFADLALNRTADGEVVFSWEPIDEICLESGIDPDFFRTTNEDNVAALIVSWYNAHRTNGGERDQIAEELIDEVRLEEITGQIITTLRNQ